LIVKFVCSPYILDLIGKKADNWYFYRSKESLITVIERILDELRSNNVELFNLYESSFVDYIKNAKQVKTCSGLCTVKFYPNISRPDMYVTTNLTMTIYEAHSDN
jgi:hypothetical protein